MGDDPALLDFRELRDPAPDLRPRGLGLGSGPRARSTTPSRTKWTPLRTKGIAHWGPGWLSDPACRAGRRGVRPRSRAGCVASARGPGCTRRGPHPLWYTAQCAPLSPDARDFSRSVPGADGKRPSDKETSGHLNLRLLRSSPSLRSRSYCRTPAGRRRGRGPAPPPRRWGGRARTGRETRVGNDPRSGPKRQADNRMTPISGGPRAGRARPRRRWRRPAPPPGTAGRTPRPGIRSYYT